MSLKYCLSCGEAMESERGWEVEAGGIFTQQCRVVHWCVTRNCPRCGLVTVFGNDTKRSKSKKEQP